MSDDEPASETQARRRVALVAVRSAVGGVACGVTALLTNIFQRKQEAKNPYVRLVEVDRGDDRPGAVGHELAARVRRLPAHRRRQPHPLRRLARRCPSEKIERDPWLKRMFAGYAFAHRLPRPPRPRLHARRPGADEAGDRAAAAGACLHCHASVIPTYRRLGAGDVFEGLRGARQRCRTPTRTPRSSRPARRTRSPGGTELHVPARRRRAPGRAASTATIPKPMQLRVTRPGFLLGIRRSPRAPSRRRTSRASSAGARRPRAQPYDPNADATRQEMRSFVCGQCHVEYYCGPKTTLFFPWNKGLKVEQIERTYDATSSPTATASTTGSTRETGRRGAEGAAPGVRDVEPGHPRALGRRLRGLPHALQARGRDEGLRPLGAQPAAEHQPRLPGLPPLRGERDPRRASTTIQDRTHDAARARRRRR